VAPHIQTVQLHKTGLFAPRLAGWSLHVCVCVCVMCWSNHHYNAYPTLALIDEETIRFGVKSTHAFDLLVLFVFFVF